MKTMIIEGRRVPNVDAWEKRIVEFTEKLIELHGQWNDLNGKRIAAAEVSDDATAKEMSRQMWWVNKDVVWYERELRIDKSYINYDEQTKQAKGTAL